MTDNVVPIRPGASATTVANAETLPTNLTEGHVSEHVAGDAPADWQVANAALAAWGFAPLFHPPQPIEGAASAWASAWGYQPGPHLMPKDDQPPPNQAEGKM